MVRKYILDNQTLLNDGKKNHTDSFTCGSVDGAPKIIRNPGYFEGVLIVDVKECEVSVNERYFIRMELCENEYFIGGTVVAGNAEIPLGKMTDKEYESINTTGRYKALMTNEVNGKVYPCMRISTLTNKGLDPSFKNSVKYTAYLTK